MELDDEAGGGTYPPLTYNNAGEVWFISQSSWTAGELCKENDGDMVATHEFRAVGRNMRFTADRTPNGASIIESTRVWHDYDGDEIYGDLRLDFDGALQGFTEAEIASHEPGIGTRDWTASAGSQTTYRHGDQIGSTRAISNQPTSGDPTVTGRIVYTAFGERVWSDGAIGTRYQYAGAWGYQTMPEYASGMSHGLGGAPGDEVPFVHVGHRWYDPATGRFLQRDPIGIRGGLNLYSYVKGQPLLNTDPNGLSSITEDPFLRYEDWDEWGRAGYTWIVNKITGGCYTLARLVEFPIRKADEWISENCPTGVANKVMDVLSQGDRGFIADILEATANDYARTGVDSIPQGVPRDPITGGFICNRCHPKHQCFVGTTLIHTARGLIPIKDITPHDSVLSDNGSYYRAIDALECHDNTSLLYVISIAEETIVVSQAHRLLTSDGNWTSVENIHTGTYLETLSGSQRVTVATAIAISTADAVYNIKVSNSETYYVGMIGIAVRDW